MIQVTVSGNLGRDAEMKSTQSGFVCSFSVASNRKVKGNDETTWVDCSIWGKRAEALGPHLSKGSRVVVVGELSTREHNGKTYLQCRVSEIDLMGGGGKSGGRSAPADRGDPEPSRGAGSPSDDDIPFAPIADIG
jgi:single-strand DNA-binding protein